MTRPDLTRLYADREAAWEALRLADYGTPEASRRACDHFQECRAKVAAALLAAEHTPAQ